MIYVCETDAGIENSRKSHGIHPIELYKLQYVPVVIVMAPEKQIQQHVFPSYYAKKTTLLTFKD